MKMAKVFISFGILATENLIFGLNCWHCISEDCNTDPAKNLRATKKHCNQEQACQKVYFEILEETNKGPVMHTSTVRGCSRDCKARNDFINNCTQYLLTSRGCVRKDCCRDQDFCNGANDHFNIRMGFIYVFSIMTVIRL